MRVHALTTLCGVAALFVATPVARAQDVLVTTGNPYAAFPFSQNKQNEPAVAVDPSNPALQGRGHER